VAAEVTDDGLQSIVGVYDADGTLFGEITYWCRARIGRAHCALCEISHGTFRAKSEWLSLVAGARVRVEMWHRDDAPSDVLDAMGGRFASVAARTDRGVIVLLDPDDLAECGGDIGRFADALDRSAEVEGFAPVFRSIGASRD